MEYFLGASVYPRGWFRHLQECVNPCRPPEAHLSVLPHLSELWARRLSQLAFLVLSLLLSFSPNIVIIYLLLESADKFKMVGGVVAEYKTSARENVTSFALGGASSLICGECIWAPHNCVDGKCRASKKKLWRLSRWQHQPMKPDVGPFCVGPPVWLPLKVTLTLSLDILEVIVHIKGINCKKTLKPNLNTRKKIIRIT